MSSSAPLRLEQLVRALADHLRRADPHRSLPVGASPAAARAPPRRAPPPRSGGGSPARAKAAERNAAGAASPTRGLVVLGADHRVGRGWRGARGGRGEDEAVAAQAQDVHAGPAHVPRRRTRGRRPRGLRAHARAEEVDKAADRSSAGAARTWRKGGRPASVSPAKAGSSPSWRGSRRRHLRLARSA